MRVHGALMALLLGLNTGWLASCAITDGSYAYTTEVRVGLDYYDSWYGDDGDWCPGYRVAPPRRIIPRPDVDRARLPQPEGYRPAPGHRQIPTLPSRPQRRPLQPPR